MPISTSKSLLGPIEIYEERGHHDGQADQDWIEAEIETQKRSRRNMRRLAQDENQFKGFPCDRGKKSTSVSGRRP